MKGTEFVNRISVSNRQHRTDRSLNIFFTYIQKYNVGTQLVFLKDEVANFRYIIYYNYSLREYHNHFGY